MIFCLGKIIMITQTLYIFVLIYYFIDIPVFSFLLITAHHTCCYFLCVYRISNKLFILLMHVSTIHVLMS